MFWFLLGHFVAFLVDLVLGTRRGDRNKDLQILVLRYQLRLAQRQRPLYWLLSPSAAWTQTKRHEGRWGDGR